MSEYIYASSGEPLANSDGKISLARKEIVRCRDCKEFYFGDSEYAPVDWCDYWDAYVESSDGFCAWGERKSE